jgi:predicted nuclease with TOPRIM domain
MKNSSLNGYLSSTQDEVSTLTSENASLLNSFESLEESLRAYIHRTSELEDEINNLDHIKGDLNNTCVILEGRMIEAEEIAALQKDNMEELFIEIKGKDAEIEELGYNNIVYHFAK